MSFSTGLFIEA